MRSNQLIGSFGPGSVYDLVDFSVVIASADEWLEGKGKDYKKTLVINDIEVKQLVEKRLKELTNFNIPYIKGLMMPPISDQDGHEHDAAIGDVLAYRFPRFHRCSRCKVLCRLNKNSNQKYCNHKYSLNPNMEPCSEIPQEWRRGRLEPVRFISKCDDGHLQDFDWIKYKQINCNSDCASHKNWGSSESIFYLDETSQGDFFASIKIKCRKCNTSKSLKEIKFIQKDIKEGKFEKLDHRIKSIFTCKGSRPWIKDDVNEGCNRKLEFVPRGQSNVYIPYRESFISIPKDDFRKLNLDHNKIIEAIFNKKDVDAKEALAIAKSESYLSMIVEEALEINNDTLSDEELKDRTNIYFNDLINWKISKDAGTADDIERNYKLNELRSLSSKISSDEFICHPIPINDNKFLSEHFTSISRVEKLKIINVLLGFQRSFNTEDEDIKFHPSINKPSFLPSNISWGEGIYLEFNFDAINEWQEKNKDFISKRDDELKVKSANSLQYREPKDTLYSLIHSFSHMFIKQLAYESGFSVTELTEKIYYFPEEKQIGLLIHTTSGDAQCSMGGLSDLADPVKISNIINRSINANLSCSNDPLCAESSGQGTSALAHAACFGCIMLPEICCEVRPIKNSFLDRNLVTPINDELKPFFKTEYL